MNNELILCIPGPWADRSTLLRTVVTLEPKGRYMYMGLVLADLSAQDHVSVEVAPTDPDLPRAFELAGQGRLPPGLLPALEQHASVAYMHFPADMAQQRQRILHFSRILERAGGLAVKVESSGVAHGWERWTQLLEAGTPFDQYCAMVTLIGDTGSYYSCGMHHFDLPECELPDSIPVSEAAELMNRFNVWQIAESPVLAQGHTFSVSAEAPRFVLRHLNDARHEADDLFFNPHGLWRLDPA